MEAKYGGIPRMKAFGKRSMEWDLNDWKWDGDLFAATPLNDLSSDLRYKQLFPITSDIQENTRVSNSVSSCSDEINLGNDNGNGELEKCDEVEALNLNLGGQVYPIIEEDETEKRKGKKSKSKSKGLSNGVARCQVDDCRKDLRGGKQYHARHKVCDFHSKVEKALVANSMQRFCQQCSRFHKLQEFDGERRSCRRRLAGHNKRRRKTHPEKAANGVPLSDDLSSKLLVTLLRLLSNTHSNTSNQLNDKDMVSHLLKTLASLSATVNERNLFGLLTGSQDASTSFATREKEPPRAIEQTANLSISETMHNPSNNNIPTGRMNLNIDLNNVYDDSQDCMVMADSFDAHKNIENLTSGNSSSTATQSPSSSSGEAQIRTDRIIFKLFGKDPHDLPIVIRNQILEWMSQSPTDIEGYIRPGCIILTIYLRMENSSWDKLCYDLNRYLRKLLDASGDSFWRTGWVYTRVLDHVAFVCDGHIVLNTTLPHKGYKSSKILNVTPIAVSASERARFSVKGLNMSWSTSRLLCALEGSYLVHTSCSNLMEETDLSIKHEDVESLSFSCSVPNIHGRGFIEIEDDNLGSSFFPFIVAEQDVCSEICTLEIDIDIFETSNDKKIEARARALDFIHELGWLLHRNHLKSRLSSMDPNSDLFSLTRFKRVVVFSVDRDWCAVVKTLLTLVFDGVVDTGEFTSVRAAVVEMGLLHRAVRRNSRPMVDFLLNYDPENVLGGSGCGSGLFRPDADGPGGLTPLHVAAGKDGSEDVLDALTSDPQLVGLEAWKNSRDSSGSTPYDYASLRGHYNYIHLVQRKINNLNKSENGHLILNILPEPPQKVAGFETEKAAIGTPVAVFRRQCRECEEKVAYYGSRRLSPAIYKPAMLSMVAIAAVCVCVALLFKSSPQVMYVLEPFIWERLKFGAS